MKNLAQWGLKSAMPKEKHVFSVFEPAAFVVTASLPLPAATSSGNILCVFKKMYPMP
jgi:hypothetical protein